MDYAGRLEHVAVLGAAGKMGSGIVLLSAMEMANLSLQPENASRTFVLDAIDVSHEALAALMGYLRGQVRKAAEKKIVALRKSYADRPDLIENRDIVEQYVADVVTIVRPTTKLEAASDARIVFDAVPEDVDLKVRLLKKTAGESPSGPWVFTNTSSIPIEELDAKAGLGGRIVGVHFYNPPAVQKLVELIRAKTTAPEVATFAEAFAKGLRKSVVRSRDIAGFIGNGHFMRDLLCGIAEAEHLATTMPLVEAIYIVNRVSQDFLVRPMGIFQLIDYVGLDVCQCILGVMDARLSGQNLRSPLIDRLLAMGVKGGQHHDGTQKDGFLSYERRPTGVFDSTSGGYVPITSFKPACDQRIGPLPEPAVQWSAIVRDQAKDETLARFFGAMRQMKTLGAELALRYGRRSREIGVQLLADGVAEKPEDVNQVLLTGFFHAYGPINEYFS